MNLETVKELLSLMKENELLEVDYEEKDLKIRLKKEGTVVPKMAVAPESFTQILPGGVPSQAAGTASSENITTIKSPMVGTFYSAPTPDSDSFVSVGDQVSEKNVVCIIEAMKVMNEIKADLDGIIKEVLVKNGEPVEYGQDLFVVEI